MFPVKLLVWNSELCVIPTTPSTYDFLGYGVASYVQFTLSKRYSKPKQPTQLTTKLGT